MRLIGLDVIRGIAVFLMVIFHIFYFADMFQLINIDIENALFWRIFRMIIITLFLFCMSVSLTVVHANGIQIDKLFKRYVKLGSAALLISVVTMIIYPQKWVFFGIIHFLWLASIVGVWLIGRVGISWTLALIIFVAYFGDFITYGSLVWHVARWFDLPHYTVDFVPLIPWFGIVAFWMGVAAKGWHMPVINVMGTDNNRLGAVLAFTGRHALTIYLIHLPLLYALFLIVA